jgi:hypothetical protein
VKSTAGGSIGTGTENVCTLRAMHTSLEFAAMGESVFCEAATIFGAQSYDVEFLRKPDYQQSIVHEMFM